MEKKVVSIVLAFMLPLLSSYSQSTNKKDSNANSAAVENFIGKLMSNKQDTSKKVERTHVNPAAVEKKNAITVSSNGKAYLSCPDNNHPHMIDLGLPSGTKWACCNVGASSPEDYGGYYAWGETKQKKVYDWDTYIHCDGSKETCHNLGSSISGTRYDVAHVKWGGSWLMPSYEQFKELNKNCTREWTKVNGVKGSKFTGPNGGSIFLPAAGDLWHSEQLFNAGESCMYWSSTLRENGEYDAYGIFLGSSNTSWSSISYRFYGQSVRPVLRK